MRTRIQRGVHQVGGALFLAALVAAAGGCNGECDAGAIPAGSGAEEIAEHLAAACLSSETAIVVAVSDGENDHVAVAGTRGVDGDVVEATDSFPIASVTKSFTAALVHRLAQDGALELDAPISDWYPGVPNEHATLRQLMQMTSGVPDIVQEGDYQKRWTESWSEDALVAWIREQKPQFEPGTGWKYSNSNYLLLGYVIEDITGLSLAEAYRSYITEPFGLSHTGLSGVDEMPETQLTGYASDGTSAPFEIDESIIQGAGGLFSTGADMIAWSRVLAGDELLDDDHKALMFERGPGQDFLKETFSGPYASGVERLTVENKLVIGHSGGHPRGFTTWFAFEPESGASAFAVVNRMGGNPKHVVLTALKAMLREH